MSGKGLLSFHIDNTTLQRMDVLLGKAISLPRTYGQYFDFLHSIEFLLIADNVNLDLYPLAPSCSESERIIDSLKMMTSSNGISLISADNINLDERKTAAKHAMEALLDKFPTYDDPLNCPINELPIEGILPPKAKWECSIFWEYIFINKIYNIETIKELAEEHLLSGTEDSEMIYATTHTDTVFNILESFKKQGQWPINYWAKITLCFRAEFNKKRATDKRRVYTPGYARSIALGKIYSYFMTQLNVELNNIRRKIGINIDKNDNRMLPIEQVDLPLSVLPMILLGMKGYSILDKIQILRNDEGIIKLRSIIAELIQLESDDNIKNTTDYIRKSNLEIKQIVNGVAHELGVDFDKCSDTIIKDFGIGLNLILLNINATISIDNYRRLNAPRRPDVILLSRGIANGAQFLMQNDIVRRMFD